MALVVVVVVVAQPSPVDMAHCSRETMEEGQMQAGLAV